MLKEFEDAVRGMKAGESKTFPLSFPADYHGKDVAGKQADFLVTLNKVEAAHLPEVDEAFVKSLGIGDGTVEALRADIRKNLEREVKFRLQARNKAAAMDALIAKAELDLPKASVDAEVERLVEGARADLKQRGMPMPTRPRFRPSCSRTRPSAACAWAWWWPSWSRPTPARQARADRRPHQELAASYESPADVVRWYKGDNRRMAEVEAIVIENNVTEFVLAKAKVTEKAVSFEELMGQA
jgi:trigger factor